MEREAQSELEAHSSVGSFGCCCVVGLQEIRGQGLGDRKEARY